MTRKTHCLKFALIFGLCLCVLTLFAVPGEAGKFKKEYKFQIFADEYVNGKLTKTDTLLDYKNDYGYYVDGDFKQGFIDQLKIFTKTDDNQCELKITTYALGTKKEISLEKVDDRQFYKWREYEETSWKLNQKVA